MRDEAEDVGLAVGDAGQVVAAAEAAGEVEREAAAWVRFL